MELLDYFKLHAKLSTSTEWKLEKMFQTIEVPKGMREIEPDTFSKKIYFIEKGLARSFYFKETKDITHFFFGENDFYTSIDSVFYQKINPYGLEFLEKSTARVANYAELEELINETPELQLFARQFLIQYLKRFSERLDAIQFQTAQERYQTMMENHPDILLRASLGHVASYLGITQQTLSVIRAQK